MSRAGLGEVSRERVTWVGRESLEGNPLEPLASTEQQ